MTLKCSIIAITYWYRPYDYYSYKNKSNIIIIITIIIIALLSKI